MSAEHKRSFQLSAAAALLVVALAGCASSPPPPDWQFEAHGGANKAVQAYLQGQDRVEAQEWERARAAISATGRPDWLARLELLRCAARTASLMPETDCPAYEALHIDDAPAEQAYARYLKGERLDAAQVALLPPAQRGVAGAGDAAGGGALPAQDADPLARLVAAGVLVRQGRGDALALATAAIDTASAQGWRRPLLAWLLWGAQRAQAQGEVLTAQQWRRRAAVVERVQPQ